MRLPEALEPLRNKKVWMCYPMAVYDPEKHNGLGGYHKPPVSPHTLYNGSSNDPRDMATFDEATAQIGKTARVRIEHAGLVDCKIAGVSIALAQAGLCGLDLDGVAKSSIDDSGKRSGTWTKEAREIFKTLGTYTELSPSGSGLHMLFYGKLPEDAKKIVKSKPDMITRENKAEYQLFDSGCLTVSGIQIGNYGIADCADQIAQVYEKFFVGDEIMPPQELSNTPPAGVSSVVSCKSSGYTYERWLEDVRRLSDADILDRIFRSGQTGDRVRALYGGDTSWYGHDHSRADQALCTFLYGFTSDRATTERLFRSSALYRASGKSRNYLKNTLDKAERNCRPLIGHIEFTAAERKAYALEKQKEERAVREKKRKDDFGNWLAERAKGR